MRCSAYCIGNALDLQTIIKDCKSQKKTYQVFTDVIHIKLSEASHAYYFKNGTVITWNITKKNSQQIAKDALQYADSLNDIFLEEHFIYRFGDSLSMKSHDYFNVEIITLTEYDDESRLAISYGLSHSIKLSSYQQLLSEMTNKYSYLIEQLSKTGTIHLKRKEISKILGKIFWVKNLINLRGEYLTTPAYFWQHVSVESLYLMVERYMDIPKRLGMLNQKLDILNELFGILSNQLQHQHSSTLEWIIIILIGVEIVFSILQFFV